MKEQNEFKLSELISLFLKKNNISNQFLSKEAENAWPKVTGKLITKLTLKVKVVNSVMYVTLASSALKHELSYKHDELVKRINEYVSENVIDKIIFC